MAAPTFAQVTVLGRSTQEALVEAPDLEELRARDHQVVRGEEPTAA